MELDARSAIDGTSLVADLCIVGAGPVGLSLAHALRDVGKTVVVVESGGPLLDPACDALNAGNVVGDPLDDLQRSRSRAIGGTAGSWNTMVQGAVGAKYLPLDPIDFEAREWMPWSGWPFGRDALNPYYRRAQEVSGLARFEYGAETWTDDRHPLLDLSRSGLANGVFHFGPADRFRRAIPDLLGTCTTVTLVSGATVTGLARIPGGGRIQEARWLTLTGRRGLVRASRFVLAAGAIENARLLLLDQLAHPRQELLGDWVGRGFTEHPIDASMELLSRAPALMRTPSFYVPHPAGLAPSVMGRIALTPELLRDARLPSASVRLMEGEGPALLRAAGPRAIARRLVPSPAARRAIGNVIRRVAAARDRVRGTTFRLLIDLEQVPHRDNRVVLSSQRDPFGLPRAELHWRWRSADAAHQRNVRAVIARELERAGLGRTRVVADRPLNPNAHHHSGTTRMHADPDQGVVDETLRVHGYENLFVAGSSVFPTSGFANPTLSAIALALRLADHLAGKERRAV